MIIINLKMDKKSEMGSSIYFSDKTGSMGSQKEGRHKFRVPSCRVEIVNQNLGDAIKEVKNNIRENPEWHLNVKPVQ